MEANLIDPHPTFAALRDTAVSVNYRIPIPRLGRLRDAAAA